jgi:hypothetical protein
LRDQLLRQREALASALPTSFDFVPRASACVPFFRLLLLNQEPGLCLEATGITFPEPAVLRKCNRTASVSSDDVLAGLRSNEFLTTLIRARNDLHGILKNTVQGIGECGGETRRQKVDIKL